MTKCQGGHPECRATDSEEVPVMPTRVIDIGLSPGSMKLVQTSQETLREPYIALSYCWGQGAKDATDLNDDNIFFLMEYIDEDNLTLTHKDCIAIARQLGIRYLWIDSLCIIQRNRADWEYESKRMAEVYGNAALTIIAGRAADSRNGFMINKVEQAMPPCPLSFGKNMGNVYLSLPRSKIEGPVSTRGWCFQEKVLSRRALIYATEQVSFSCQRSQLWEDGRLTMHDPSHLRIGSFPDAPELTNMSSNVKQRELKQSRTRMLRLWYQKILPDYTLRQLTEPSDIFAACSSISQLARKTIRSRYLAGIWEADMVRGLLWCTAYSIKGNLKTIRWPKSTRPVDRDGKKVVRAPTWSVSYLQLPT